MSGNGAKMSARTLSTLFRATANRFSDAEPSEDSAEDAITTGTCIALSHGDTASSRTPMTAALDFELFLQPCKVEGTSMNRIFILVFCVLSLAVCSACAQRDEPKEPQNDALSKLIGDWSGTSTCVNKDKFPACNDENVVYHITRVADKKDTVNLSADKIVNGKPDFMGAYDMVYDAEKQTLTTEVDNGRVRFLIEFVIKDDAMEGRMISLPDKTQARQMKVKKDK
jgi:hypothetical protein